MKKTYKQNSNPATLAKWRRMCANVAQSPKNPSIEVGFSTWWLDRSGDTYRIVAQTNYHVESTLDAMYDSNFKNWN